jgi:hypothetical protein
MTSSIRRYVLVAGVAALMSSQAAYAAPSVSAFDPLVSLAVLGSDQSRAAVCAGSSAAVAAAAAVAQAPAAGCVLPVTTPPPPPPVAEAAPPPAIPAAAPKAIGTLPILLGLAALVGVIVLIATSGNHHNGNLVPVSPA